MIMKSNVCLLSALFTLAFAAAACSSGDDDGTGTGGGAGTGGATGGSSGKGGAGGGAGTGTGGSTGGSAGTGSTGSPVLDACMAFCRAEEDCKADTAAEDCYDYLCTNRTAVPPYGNIKDAPAACGNAWKGYWDCLAASSDPCVQPGPCETQAGAIGTACPME